MNNQDKNRFSPHRIMNDFYKLDDPTEEEQFLFVEAMEYLIQNAKTSADIMAYCYNLGIYYREIKNFRLARKYLEIGAYEGSSLCQEQLGVLCYYGYDDLLDYELAYEMFEVSKSRRSHYMLAEMYRWGQYVEKDVKKCRDILERLMENAELDRVEGRATNNTLYPEIALRLARLNMDEGKYMIEDMCHLADARKILSICQKKMPSWCNIITMRDIIRTLNEWTQSTPKLWDLYDLLVMDLDRGRVTFKYNNMSWKIDIFRDAKDVIYQFEGKWYHGIEGFLEKARIDKQRITSVIDQITYIQIERGEEL